MMAKVIGSNYHPPQKKGGGSELLTVDPPLTQLSGSGAYHILVSLVSIKYRIFIFRKCSHKFLNTLKRYIT